MKAIEGTNPLYPATYSQEIKEHFKIRVEQGRDPHRLIVPLFDEKGVLKNKLHLRESDLLLPLLHFQKALLRLTNQAELTNILYHADQLSLGLRCKLLIVTFGLGPVWSLWRYGYPDTIGVLGDGISNSLTNYLDSVLEKQGVIWVITDHVGGSMKIAQKVAGHLASIRFTRLVTKTGQPIVSCSSEEISQFFSEC